MGDKDEKSTEEKKDDKFTVADLRKLVTDTVAEITGKGSDSGEPERRHVPGTTRRDSIADTVSAEVERLRAAEAREQREKTIDEQIKSLTDAVKEKPPVERRRVHNFMGWGE